MSGRLRVLELIAGLGDGGAESQLALLVPALGRAGCDVDVACLVARHGRAGAALAGFPIHDLRGGVALDPRPWIRLAELIRRERFDVVHSHLGRPDVLAGWACRRAPAPRPAHVVTRHSDYEPWSRVPPLWRLYRGALGRADRVLAVSEAVARTVRAWGAPAERVAVVPGVLADRRLLELAAPTPPLERIGFAGRLEHVKGLDLFCRAAALLTAARPELRVAVAGTGSQARRWRAWCDRRGVPVEWLGWVDDRVRLLAALDVVMVPSRREGLGHAAAEAIAAGRPVVATDVGGLAELLAGRPDARTVPLTGDRDTATALASATTALLDAGARGDRRPAVHLDPDGWAAAHVGEFTEARGVAARSRP